MTRKKNLFLVDGTALAYRSHFAFSRNPLTSPDGKPTGAIYGYTLTLKKLLEKAKPDFGAVAFDGPEKTFRHKILPEYKATREKTPPELLEQLDSIKAITRAMGIPVVEKKGIEADDVIGTLARKGEKKGLEVYIVSGDKDFSQLVSKRIRILNISTKSQDAEILDEKGVEKKWGVPPELFVDFLALTGDSSDNIPGIPGVGPKTAVELIKTYGSLEKVLEEGATYKKPRIAKAIAQHKSKAILARDLVKILTDVDLPVDIKDLEVEEPDRERLKEIYAKLGFKSLLSKLADDAGSKERDHDYVTIDGEDKLEEFLGNLKSRKEFAVDTETTSLEPMRAKAVGLSFSWESGLAFYIPLNKSSEGWREKVLSGLRPILENRGSTKVGQNIKYDMIVLYNEGIALKGELFDTMVASYCVSPEEKGHGLDALCLKYLNYRKIPTTDLLGKGKKQKTMDMLPIEQVSEYACEDADYTWRLKAILEKELRENGVDELFYDLEMPLVNVLASMEVEGIRVDKARLSALSRELEKRIQDIEKQVFELAGVSFNLRSSQQVSQVLFEKLEIHKKAGLKKPRRMKTGAYSTDASVLESLAPHHPLPGLLLRHRELSKLKNTYVDALPGLVNPRTGRIHTSFNQTVTATGRLSSSDPNLQNIPIRTAEGRKVRSCFVPREKGWKFLSLDYSQIELRIMAHFSGDDNLISAFRKGEDIHARTASLILGKKKTDITMEERAMAKVVNFGILYGMGPKRLARETGLSVREATEFIEKYFNALPGVKRWLSETLERAREEECVTTIFGRKRRLPEILSPHERIRIGAENMAVNTPIQGSAADIVKKAMIQAFDFIMKNNMKSRLVLQVHDELLFDCPAEEIQTMERNMKRIMESVVKLEVPLKVESGVGDDWLSAHP